MTIDRVALLFALAATGLSGVVFGLFPAVQLSRADAQELVLRRRAAGAASDSHRLRRTLVACEVALAVVLLSGAGLMAQTLRSLMTVDPGFRPDHLLTGPRRSDGGARQAGKAQAIVATLRSPMLATTKLVGSVGALRLD